MFCRSMDSASRFLREPTVVRLAVLVGIPSFAFVIRAACLIKTGSAWAFDGDSPQYVALSNGLSHGCGFAYWLGGSCGGPDVFRTPLYPAFLTIFGGAWRLAVACQALLGALTCAVVAAFVCDRYGVAPAAFAGGVVATDVPSIFVTRHLMSDPLCQFMLTVGMLLFLSGSYPTPRTRSPLLRVVIGGLFVGLGVLTRPAAIAALPILVLVLLFAGKRSGTARIRFVALGLVLPVGLLFVWMLRNYRVAGTWTMSTEGAQVLYFYTAPGVLSESSGESIESIRAEFASDPRLSAERAVSDCPGKIGINSYDLIMCTVIAHPALSRPMLWRSMSVIRSHPIQAVLITTEGFLRLALQPHVPGMPDTPINHNLFHPKRTASSLTIKGLVFGAIIWSIVAFEGAVLALIWVGVVKSVWRAFGVHPVSDRVIPILFLLGAGVLLLLPAVPAYYAWDSRYRILSIPFLAIVAATGWFHEAEQINGHAQTPASKGPDRHADG